MHYLRESLGDKKYDDPCDPKYICEKIANAFSFLFEPAPPPGRVYVLNYLEKHYKKTREINSEDILVKKNY